jgi:hypothetical protein
MKRQSSILTTYYNSRLPKAQGGVQTPPTCPEGFSWNEERQACTLPDGRTLEELKASNDATWSDIATDYAANVGKGALATVGAGALAIKAAPLFNRFTDVNKKLKQIELEGKLANLSDWDIARRQMSEVGITSGQRAAYNPITSPLAKRYVYPYGYTGMGKYPNKLAQIWDAVKSGGLDKTQFATELGSITPARADAWKLYLGMPQEHGTFEVATTAPFNHPSYKPGQLSKLETFSISPNADGGKTYESIRPIDIFTYGKNGLRNELGSETLVNRAIKLSTGPMSIDVGHDVMGGYNKRLSSLGGLEYNDVWDLNPEITPSNFFPESLKENSFFKKLLYDTQKKYNAETGNYTIISTPKNITIDVGKFVGKPFFVHGVMQDFPSKEIFTDDMLQRLEAHKQKLLQQGNKPDMPNVKRVQKAIDKLSKGSNKNLSAGQRLRQAAKNAKPVATPTGTTTRSGQAARTEVARPRVETSTPSRIYSGVKGFGNFLGRLFKEVGKREYGGMITDPMGQWKYPGMNTRIPGGNITMQGVPYPVLAMANNGMTTMMQPGQNYYFPGADYVDEYPMMQQGGDISLPNVYPNQMISRFDEGGIPGCPPGQVWNAALRKCVTLPPIYTTNPNLVRAFNDSTTAYNNALADIKFTDDAMKSGKELTFFSNDVKPIYTTTGKKVVPSKKVVKYKSSKKLKTKDFKKKILPKYQDEIIKGLSHNNIEPVNINVYSDVSKFYDKNGNLIKDVGENNETWFPEFQKPVQEYILQNPISGSTTNQSAPINNDVTDFAIVWADPNEDPNNLTQKVKYFKTREEFDEAAKKLGATNITQRGKSAEAHLGVRNKTPEFGYGGIPYFGPGGSVANGCGPYMAKNSAGQCVPEHLAHLPPTSTNLLGSARPSATQQMGMATVPGQYGKGSVDYSMGANPLTVAKQQKQYQDIKSEREYQKERSKQTSVGPARKKTPMEEERDQALKQQFVATYPGYSKLDEQGNIVPTQVDRSVAGTPDYGSRAYYNDRGLNTFAEGLDYASMLYGAGEVAALAKPFFKQAITKGFSGLKSGLGNVGKAIDRKIYPTRAYRSEVIGGNPQGYTVSGEAATLADKVFKKGDWATKDLTEAFQYLTGKEKTLLGEKAGLVTGNDMLLTEYKVPFWKKNITFDKDVVALKQLQKANINPNEFIIPNNKFLYPRRTNVISAVPEHLKNVQTTLPSGRVRNFYDKYSIALTPDNVIYSSKPYKYIEDQINAVTGHNMPITYTYDEALGRNQNIPILNWKQSSIPSNSGVGRFRRFETGGAVGGKREYYETSQKKNNGWQFQNGGPLVEFYKGKMTGPNIFEEGGQSNKYFYNEGYGVPQFEKGGDIPKCPDGEMWDPVLRKCVPFKSPGQRLREAVNETFSSRKKLPSFKKSPAGYLLAVVDYNKTKIGADLSDYWEGLNKYNDLMKEESAENIQETNAEKILKKSNDDKVDIAYGYNEYGEVPDKDKKRKFAKFTYTFDNDAGARYVIGNKVKEVTEGGAKKHFKNVKAVAHFLRDSDILPNQKFAPSEWTVHGGNKFVSTSPGRAMTSVGFDRPDWYRTLYKPNPSNPEEYLVKYIKNKDITEEQEARLKKEGWALDFTVSGQSKFSDVDWEGDGPSTKYGVVSRWLPLKNGNYLTIPYKDKKGFSRFSGGSITYLFKHPKTGKSIGIDVAGSVNDMKVAGENLIKRYNLKPNQLDFIFHDMGSYSAKPKATGKDELDYDQWIDFNSYNRGYSGAPLMIPSKKYGGVASFQNGGEPCPEGFVRLNGECVEIEIANAAKAAEEYITGWYNSPKYKQRFAESLSPGEEYMIQGREQQLADVPNIKWASSPGNFLGITNPKKDKNKKIYLNLKAHTPQTLEEQSLAQTAGHEIDHIINKGGKYIPQKTIDFLNSIRPNDFSETPFYQREVAPFVKTKRRFMDKMFGTSGTWMNREEVDDRLRERNREENWHQESPFDNPYNPELYKALRFGFNYYNPTDKNKTEPVSFWNKIRQDAKELGVYDPYTEDFDEQKFQKFLEMGNTPKTRDFRKLIDWYGKDNVIEGMNKVVKMGDRSENLSMAKNGGPGDELSPEQLASLNRAKMRAKMALAAEWGNPSARRMMNPTPPSYKFSGNEMFNGKPVVGFGEGQTKLGDTGTHRMTSIDSFAVPYIQQNPNGTLFYNQDPSPRDREAIRFGNPQDAEYFAEHYKEVAPMMQNFKKNGGPGPGDKEKKEVRDILFNLPIGSSDIRYPEYQGNIKDWGSNLDKVKVVINPQATGSVSPGRYVSFNTPAPEEQDGVFQMSSLDYPYRGSILLNPSLYTPIDNERRVIRHELTHGAFDSDKYIPNWLADNLRRTARNPYGFETGEHHDQLVERVPMLMGTRKEVLDYSGLPLNSKVPRDVYNSYLRGMMETGLRTGRPVEPNEVKESLFGARTASDVYNLMNMEMIPERQYGGDISIPNVYPNQMIPKFDPGGSLDCPCPDQPDCKCPEVTYTHNPGTKGIYRLQRTVTPYTSNRDIRRYTQAPTDPRQVNFIQNYAGAIGYQDDPSFVYPTQVPMEGEKHWNIDKFLIDPQFSRKYGRLENAETTKEQARANALADMYKYYMLQYPNKKGKAFRQAKRFVRREIDPRISGPFYDYYLNKDLSSGIGGIESFADANRLEQLYQVNPVPAQADMDRLKDVSIDYFRNYRKMSKKDAEALWNSWERGAAQPPAGDPAFYNNSTEMSEPLVPLKYGGFTSKNYKHNSPLLQFYYSRGGKI